VTASSEAIVDQAIAWHLSLTAASDDDWMRFTSWLEADVQHAAAYDRIVTDDAFAAHCLDLGEEARSSVTRATEQQARWRRRSGWLMAGGGAIAASLAAVVMLPAGPPKSASQAIVTAMGEHRSITLPDGTRVDLNGGTELALADSGRSATLVRGQATFRVKHNESAPFEVVSGNVVLRDVGTVFDVTRDGGRLGVQVAEGSVMFRPDREAVMVRQGMSLISSDRDDRLVLRPVAPDSVGGWRGNRLTFRETPLRLIAAAVGRTTGTRLSVSDKLAETPFTGTIRLVGNDAEDAAHVAALTGTTAHQDAGRWILTSGTDASH
jgi:transmembrane sensor